MIGKLLDRLTYANVVATIALVAGVSGGTLGAYAAISVRRNSVGTRQLQAKAVTNGKLANAAVTGAKIAEGTITGTNVNLSALGTVPQAANSANSAEAQKLDKHEASCPANTNLIRGLCFDTHSNPVANNLEEATEACAAKGGYLPTPMELYSVKGILNLGNNIGSAEHQYTDELFGEITTGEASETVVVDGVGPPIEQEADQPSAYYCVYPFLR
ncbi:MAG: hypothetical protein WB507_09160 [Solirubrobacterales bacterium]